MRAHHILLVEDNPGDVRLIEESLRLHGLDYRLTHYETADAAINALARCGTNGSGVPDLILLDFNVPRGDARDILAAASSNLALAAIPKVIPCARGSGTGRRSWCDMFYRQTTKPGLVSIGGRRKNRRAAAARLAQPRPTNSGRSYRLCVSRS
jgi:CheY-like chemotaxis protein